MLKFRVSSYLLYIFLNFTSLHLTLSWMAFEPCTGMNIIVKTKIIIIPIVIFSLFFDICVVPAKFCLIHTTVFLCYSPWKRWSHFLECFGIVCLLQFLALLHWKTDTLEGRHRMNRTKYYENKINNTKNKFRCQNNIWK